MRMRLIAVGTKMPVWVQEGYLDYARRLPSDCSLQLTEVAAPARAKTVDCARLIRQEGERLLKSIPKNSYMVALDNKGKMHTSESLARLLDKIAGSGKDLCFIIGGPDGLSPSVLEQVDEMWSLSPLVFPHPLVRVIIAEQLFRALSILKNHPYHRA